MTSLQRHFSLNSIALPGALALCWLYWLYLFLASQMEIAMDASGYEILGSRIYQQGWDEYFRTGPNREPLYPFVISLAMRIGDFFSWPYPAVQKTFQILMLGFSQLLALRILRTLKVNQIVRAFVILYLGFSPALVNSAFSLFSEILTYPLMLS